MNMSVYANEYANVYLCPHFMPFHGTVQAMLTFVMFYYSLVTTSVTHGTTKKGTECQMIQKNYSKEFYQEPKSSHLRTWV